MHRGLVWLVASCVLVMAGAYTWSHRQRVVQSVAAPVPVAQTHTQSDEEKAAQQLVTVAGPLAQMMSDQKPEEIETQRGSFKGATAPGVHVGGSPVGTSRAVLHQTFPVAHAVNWTLELPPQSSTPRLRGTFHSFVTAGSNPAGDASAGDVEFLVFNAQQYEDFLAGHAGDALFSAPDSHDQEVNFSLPPTYNEAAQYHLVFRNNSGGKKKMVKADLHVDF